LHWFVRYDMHAEESAWTLDQHRMSRATVVYCPVIEFTRVDPYGIDRHCHSLTKSVSLTSRKQPLRVRRAPEIPAAAGQPDPMRPCPGLQACDPD
jgi:hypothetical protein